jgi:toxin ParE1/3/4
VKSINYARRAKTDLEDITDYTACTWGAQQAKNYIREIRTQIAGIANGDVIAQSLQVARAGMFKCRINRHLIIFEQTNDQVRVIRILHETMDVPRHIGP